MKQRDIAGASIAGAILIAFLLTAGCGLVLALSGCTLTPPAPGPVTPPKPEPGPAATCDGAASRALELRCVTDAATFVDACKRYAQLGEPAAWDTGCMAASSTCSALEACR